MAASAGSRTRRLFPLWTRPDVTTPVGKATALVAAASRLSTGDLRSRRRKAGGKLADWQEEGWEHYDECGQLRYVINLTADMMSRARLYLTKVDENGEPAESPPPGPNGSPSPPVFGGPTVQKQLLYSFGIQLGVPGDCFLVGEEETDKAGKPTGRERWQVLSLEEFNEDEQGNWVIDSGGGKRTVDPETTAVIRVWRPHPRKYEDADSQVRANRRPLRILARLSKYVQAVLDSRLAGPGLLLLPEELSFAAPNQEINANANAAPKNDADEFMQMLSDSMTTAIQDPDSVSSVVPIVIKGKAEFLKEARLLTLDTPLAKNLGELEQQAVKALALGLDVPPEVLLGLADANHWSAWQLEEATIKYVVEPLLELVCAALTEQFIWPALEGVEGIGDVRDWLIWYDSTELTKRPDKSGAAKDAKADGAIGERAYRRELGFSDDDAPTPVEREYRQLLELCQAVPAVAPQIAQRLLQLIAAMASGLDEAQGTPLLEIEQPSEPAPAPADEETPPAEGDKQPGDRTLPDRSEEAGIDCPATASGFVAACEQLALVTLRRANNKNAARQRYRLTGVAPEAFHLHVPVIERDVAKLVDGLAVGARQLAGRLIVDPEQLEQALTAYVTLTLVGGLAHDVTRLEDHLVTAVCGARTG